MLELRNAIRSLLHTPAFAVGAGLTFALGIGVNTVVFSAVDRVLFRALPFDHPERLFVLNQYRVGATKPGLGVQAPLVARVRTLPGVDDLAVLSYSRPAFRFTAEPDNAHYFNFVPVAYSALRTLGVRLAIGSDFTEADAREKRKYVLITHSAWQREFSGRRDIIGQSVWGEAPGYQAEIRGVLPGDFFPPQLRSTQAWSGLILTTDVFDGPIITTVFTPPILRLKSGFTREQVQAQVDVAVAGLRSVTGGNTQTGVARLEPIREALFGRYASYIGLVVAAAGVVLLVACANLASLLLVRARSQEHRIAIQLALGASRQRLVWTSLTETLVIAATGCLISMLAMRTTGALVQSVLPTAFTSYVVPPFEPRVIVFAMVVALLSAVVTGVLPAWFASRVDLLAVLQRGPKRTGSARVRGSASLLALEIGFSTVLVVGAILMSRTLSNIKAIDVGFDTDRLMTASVNLSPAGGRAVLLDQFPRILDVLRRAHNVEAVAGADSLPIVGVVNKPMIRGTQVGQRCAVTDGFIETMGMRVLAGRTISPQDARTGAPVGVVSLEALDLLLPGVSPQQAIGRFLELPDELPREVIGVVSDVRYPYLAPTTPTMYVPHNFDRVGGMMFAVRMKPGQRLTSIELERHVRATGATPESIGVGIVADSFASAIVDHTFRARLFAVFGFLAILLAIIGVYAVQSFTLAQRSREFSIRTSLGATPSQLIRLVLTEAMRPTTVGIAIGLLVAYWASRFLEVFLYGIEPRDPMTFVGVGALLVLVVSVAVLATVGRAAYADPVVALRME